MLEENAKWIVVYNEDGQSISCIEIDSEEGRSLMQQFIFLKFLTKDDAEVFCEKGDVLLLNAGLPH